ncbi:MAG: hypothetical protein IJJ33_19480, partial [Victivallales bacterium]|nr:hypothetical protein [Victivallales bacterium]
TLAEGTEMTKVSWAKLPNAKVLLSPCNFNVSPRGTDSGVRSKTNVSDDRLVRSSSYESKPYYVAPGGQYQELLDGINALRRPAFHKLLLQVKDK